MYKIFRMGHRTPNNGVITVASHIKDNKIFYGVSYYSPNELIRPTFDDDGNQQPFVQYNKQFGIELAVLRLEQSIHINNYIPLSVLEHGVVLLDIINDILEKDTYPVWAEQLLIDNVLYPVGLKRYNKKNSDVDFNMAITVNSEETKEQLLLASAYIHNLQSLDTSFIAVNWLAHLYTNPDLITVDDESV